MNSCFNLTKLHGVYIVSILQDDEIDAFRLNNLLKLTVNLPFNPKSSYRVYVLKLIMLG